MGRALQGFGQEQGKGVVSCRPWKLQPPEQVSGLATPGRKWELLAGSLLPAPTVDAFVLVSDQCVRESPVRAHVAAAPPSPPGPPVPAHVAAAPPPAPRAPVPVNLAAALPSPQGLPCARTGCICGSWKVPYSHMAACVPPGAACPSVPLRQSLGSDCAGALPWACSSALWPVLWASVALREVGRPRHPMLVPACLTFGTVRAGVAHFAGAAVGPIAGQAVASAPAGAGEAGVTHWGRGKQQ